MGMQLIKAYIYTLKRLRLAVFMLGHSECNGLYTGFVICSCLVFGTGGSSIP